MAQSPHVHPPKLLLHYKFAQCGHLPLRTGLLLLQARVVARSYYCCEQICYNCIRKADDPNNGILRSEVGTGHFDISQDCLHGLRNFFRVRCSSHSKKTKHDEVDPVPVGPSRQQREHLGLRNPAKIKKLMPYTALGPLRGH